MSRGTGGGDATMRYTQLGWRISSDDSLLVDDSQLAALFTQHSWRPIINCDTLDSAHQLATVYPRTKCSLGGKRFHGYIYAYVFPGMLSKPHMRTRRVGTFLRVSQCIGRKPARISQDVPRRRDKWLGSQ